MVILYQFPISHYCEKIRWALDYKKIDYEVQNMLPGMHMKKAMSLTNKTEVPILKHNDVIVQNSSDIISYIDSTFTGLVLTPEDEVIKKQALEWEAYVDKEIGPYLRVYFYNTLLKHPDILISIFSHNGPWYGKLILKFIYPKLSKAMRRMMRINDKTAEKAKIHIDQGIDKLNAQLEKQKFLAGDQFTRADLAAASLLAPITQPEKYGLPWPSPLPEPLQQSVDSWAEKIPWVRELYQIYR